VLSKSCCLALTLHIFSMTVTIVLAIEGSRYLERSIRAATICQVKRERQFEG
jgi:hypothetical protein